MAMKYPQLTTNPPLYSRHRLRRISGFLMLDALAAIFISILGFMFTLYGIGSSKINDLQFHQTVAADMYAVELLEFFKGMNGAALEEYLNTNPIDNTLQPYPICSYVNVLDRASGHLINKDPTAHLTPSILDGPPGGPTFFTQATRYYRVERINLGTLATLPDSDRCPNWSLVGSTWTLPALAPNTYKITVGVTWVKKKGNGAPELSDVKQVELSTVLVQ